MGATAGILGHILGCTKNEWILCIQGTIVSFALGCLNLAWFIAGQVIVWREAGLSCRGLNENPDVDLNDTAYLVKSGKFIRVWTIIEYSLCGLFCLGTAFYFLCVTPKPLKGPTLKMHS